MSGRLIPRRPDVDTRMHEPSSAVHPHPLIPPSPSVVPNVSPNAIPSSSVIQKLAVANEQTWLLIGRVAEQMGDLEHAITAYENALRHNPMSLPGLTQVAGIARIKENYPKAVESFQRVLQLQEDNGEVWSALGHCYLMQDDLQKAYSAYQQALYLLPNPKEDPKLWYGIGILYDRYGSLDHAEEAFASVLKMDKDLDFDKANEILFRLGIIYKQQAKYEESLNCFDRILRNPPSPLAHADIWFQIGHVYEQQKDHARAKDAYERVVADNPGHAKVLQQLGWLYHQDGSNFQNQDLAIQYLTKSLEADPSDAQSWYLLGRAYMAGQKYNKAYEAYQQAVYRDGRNPTFWCSIGVLYFQINQFRDALDAYSRAIRINPYISEVWFDLGSLYESCNNQISDAIDAYARASELDPGNPVISQRLQLLKSAQATGAQLPAAPGPQDVHPTAYASAVVPPPGLSGPPLLLQSAPHNRPLFRTDSRGPSSENHLPLPPPPTSNGRSSPGPFRGGPPPPVVLDESRHMMSHTPLAPMDIDRPHHTREYSNGGRENGARGPSGQHMLLHHPVPQQHPAEELRPGPGQYQEFTRPPLRVPSTSSSPPPRAPRSPVSAYPNYAPPTVGPAQPSVASQRSPHSAYPHDIIRHEQEGPWERRPPPPEHHRGDWDRRRHEYPAHQQPPYFPPRSPAHPAHSPPAPSPHSAHPRGFWESKPPNGPARSPPPPVNGSQHENGHWARYDPARFDARDARDPRDPREYEREGLEHRRESGGAYTHSPESARGGMRGAPHLVASNHRGSESPLPQSVEPKKRIRAAVKEKDNDVQSVTGSVVQEATVKRAKRRVRRPKDEQQPSMEAPKFTDRASVSMIAYREKVNYKEESSSNGTGATRSIQPSPTSATHHPPSRVVDEDYDEGVADALVVLSQSRAPEMPAHSPTSNGNGVRYAMSSPRPVVAHRESIPSSRCRPSPPSAPGSASLKRPLSPGPDDLESKRSRVDVIKQRSASSSGGRHTPMPSSRPSPIPFRTQPQSLGNSPESRQHHIEPAPAHYAPVSPQLAAVVLPPHPRPIGPSHGGHVALPPIATLSPTSSVPSPIDDRMQVDSHPRNSVSPAGRGKMVGIVRSPQSKHTSPSSARSLEKSEVM